ncbi:hypothetical protein GCM10012285_65900 [Streptomyces kronopolitis]|uniref:Uncharacterized protein n=1 Tax=Streptomyces kronopolitis TaxID=1612435 RepID=A0ABQ2K2R0_9ACTN|nr:DUF6233 domain-containing protein [Streptomyces kronopolitis]GGN64124.1 hypothetical protein GCM10012285_65900 [Streptomyces kronopolitis]
MSDTSPLPDDVERLTVIATYLQLELERVHRALARAQQREQEAARQAAARAAPPPDWTVQMNVGADPRPVAVHHGDCTVGQPRVRPISRRTAIEALTAGVEACALCRPDRELQIE